MKQMDKEIYKTICRITKEFLKKGYWATFSAENIFYLVDEKKQVVCSFIDSFGNEVYGIPFYFGDDGLNSLYDMFSVENDYSVSIADHCCTNIMICKKEALLPEEVQFIRNNDMNVMKDNNIIVRTFKRGYASRIANEREGELILQSLDYLKSLIQNEGNDLINSFKEDKQACAFFNNETMEYQVVYNVLPPLEKPYRKVMWSKDIITELKTFTQTDDTCYLTVRNIMVPIKINDTSQKVLPLLACYSDDNGVIKMNTIISIPNHYSVYLIGFIEEIFSSRGLPSSLIINDRKLYYAFYRLFEEIGVNLVFKRENPILDELLYNLDQSAMTFFKTNINDNQNLAISSEEFQTVFNITEAEIHNGEETTDDEDFESDDEYVEEVEKHFVS